MAFLLLVLLGVLVFWALRTTTGGGDEKPAGRDDNAGSGPAESITPGPTDTETVIDSRPGGRDESGDTGDTEGSGEAGENGETGEAAGVDGGAGGDSEGGDGGPGAEQDGGATAGSGGSGGTGTGQSGGTGGTADGEGISVPVGSLPSCRQSQVEISVESDEPEYPPGVRPALLVTVENTSGTDCRIDLGHEAVTISLSFTGGEDEEQVWTSQECPAGPASAVKAVARGASVTHTVTWDRRYSAGDSGGCAGAKERPEAPVGTYLMDVAVDLGGNVTQKAQSAFRLNAD